MRVWGTLYFTDRAARLSAPVTVSQIATAQARQAVRQTARTADRPADRTQAGTRARHERRTVAPVTVRRQTVRTYPASRPAARRDRTRRDCPAQDTGAADRTRRGCRIVSTRIKSRCTGHGRGAADYPADRANLSPFRTCPARSPRHRRGRPSGGRLSGRPSGRSGTPANLSPFRTCPASRPAANLSGAGAADRAADWTQAGTRARRDRTRERLPIVRRDCPARSGTGGTGTPQGAAADRTRRTCPADCPARARRTVATVAADRNAANGCACHLSASRPAAHLSEPIRRDRHGHRHGRTCHRSEPVRRERLPQTGGKREAGIITELGKIRTADRPAVDRGRRRTGTPQAARRDRPRARQAGRKGGRFRRVSGETVRQTVRQIGRKPDAGRGETANPCGRPCAPVRRDCPARSPQTAHRNATGGAARSGRARTCPAQADAMAGGCGAFPANLSPSGGRSRRTAAARSPRRGRGRPCGRDCPARTVATDRERLPIVRRRDRGRRAHLSGRPCAPVRRAMRMYAYASRNAARVAGLLQRALNAIAKARQAGRGETVRRGRGRSGASRNAGTA